jgi:hypothetical protein
MKPKFNRPVGEKKSLLKVVANWRQKTVDGAVLAPVATWFLHITQPNYFAPTCSEVVNLTGLLKTKD